MKKYLLLFLIVSSSYAIDIVKLNDAKVAYCSDQNDTQLSSRGLMFRLRDPKVWSISEGKMQILIGVDFYKCVDTEKGPKFFKTKFSNTKKYNFNDREVTINYRKSFFRGIGNGEVHSTSKFNPGHSSIVLTIDLTKVESVIINSKRRYFFDVDFETQAKFYADRYEGNWERLVLGAYRIFL